jgi:hypothetical protein
MTTCVIVLQGFLPTDEPMPYDDEGFNEYMRKYIDSQPKVRVLVQLANGLALKHLQASKSTAVLHEAAQRWFQEQGYGANCTIDEFEDGNDGEAFDYGLFS